MVSVLTLLGGEVCADDVDLRLHFAWGGGASRQWRGRVALSSGELRGLQLLGVDPDQPGGVQLLGQQLIIEQKQAREYDGFEVSVRAPRDARLRVELLPEGEVQSSVVTLPIGQFVNGQHTEQLDEDGNRLVIRRTPWDRVRVELRRDHLVFGPGESFEFRLQGHLLDVAEGTTLRTELTLRAAGSRTVLWEESYRHRADAYGSWAESELVTFDVPTLQGAYDLDVTIATRRLTPPFSTERVLAQRKVQFVVVNDTPHAALAQDDNERDVRRLILEVDPEEANWWQRLVRFPQWSLLPGLRADGPLGNSTTERVERNGAKWTRLPPGGWQAYPVPIEATGRMHELELDFAGDLSQVFSVSIIEPNAAGKVIPVGLDSGVRIDAEMSNGVAVQPSPMASHRLHFWPRTKSPMLLVTNLSEQDDALVGGFRVYRREFPLREQSKTTEPQRMALAYLERPLFPENFCAPESFDEATGRSFEDWNTFLEGAERLVRYARHVGYDGLAIMCASEGSTIYPSRYLQPTPKHDRGAFFSSGQDPLRKDVLEMLFRICDREGMRLVPVMEFASPLPSLEDQLRAGPTAEGIELVDSSRVTWLERFGVQRGRAAYYNPMDERVQQAMQDVFHELVVRYSQHSAFAGISISLHADGYTQLPDVDWGMDARTWSRFQAERQVRGASPDSMDESTRQQWLDWRCQHVSKTYLAMAQDLRRYRQDARLYLTGARLIESRPLQRAWRPALPPQDHSDRAMQELGLHPSYLQQSPHIVFLRPHLLSSTNAAVSAATREFNASQQADSLFRKSAVPGSHFLHDPELLRLPSFDEQSPYGAAKTYVSLVAQTSPVGYFNRRRFAHALAANDTQVLFDGGWLLPMGQEERVQEFFDVYRELPRTGFSLVDVERRDWQPITFRSMSTKDATYLYAVNDSPWVSGASVMLRGAPDAQYVPLGNQTSQPVVQDGDRTTWNLTIPPYGLIAIRADRPGISMVDASVNLPPEVKPALENEIQQLGRRFAQLRNPKSLAQLRNGSFEDWGQGTPTDWTLRGDERVLSRVRNTVHDGASALKIDLPSGSIGLRSAPFEPPASGRLSISVRTKVPDASVQPRVRLVLEVDDRVYYPWSPIVNFEAARDGEPTWKEFVFRVSHLPPAQESFRIGLEVGGSGVVLIDDIKLYDVLVLDNAEQKALDLLLSQADFQRRYNRVADCMHVLHGYWPRYLIENVPEIEPQVVEQKSVRPEPPKDDSPVREASGWDRWRRLIPFQ